MEVKLVSYSPDPAKIMSLAARTCYSEEESPLIDESWLSLEDGHWDWLVKACLDKGHFSPLEYAQFVFVATNIPMPTVVQIRTHRGLSMQVQSMRYTGKRLSNPDVTNDRLFYTRAKISPDRSGDKKVIDPEVQQEVFNQARETYTKLIESGVPPEVARDVLPCCYTQNFILSCNLRELFHLWNMRTPKDAQLEVREVMEMMRAELNPIIPSAIQWFNSKFWSKYKGSF